MRTQEQIVERLNTSPVCFDFAREVLVEFLDYEHAKPHLRPDVTAEEWAREALRYTRDVIISQMRKYMAEYGWPKCIDHRSLSAGRTVQKMAAWMWLLGDDEGVAFAENKNNYLNYGAPILKFVCERYGFDIPDDPEALRMASGQTCGATYRCGCWDGDATR